MDCGFSFMACSQEGVTESASKKRGTRNTLEHRGMSKISEVQNKVSILRQESLKQTTELR